MVSAQEFGRSLRGAAALVNRRADALSAFDVSLDGFARSFAAVTLTAPAYVVSLALERRRLGLDVTGPALLADPGIALIVAIAHLASFLALPLAMMVVARRLGLTERYVPFVIVTNWLWAFASLALAAPGAMDLAGWQTPPVAAAITIAFAAIVLNAQVFAARVTLGVGASLAVTIAALGLLLDIGVARLLRLAVG